MSEILAYQPAHAHQSTYVEARGLRQHVLVWGDLSAVSAHNPLLVMVHGWMDVGASFQFVVDELLARPDWAGRTVVALDWRGFGHTQPPAATDCYFTPNYLADLDALLKVLSPEHPIDLVGHSMGGNIVMLYAGLRPQKIRRLVNLDGLGMPATEPSQAPEQYVKWLDELHQPVALKAYDSVQGVADRLRANNPRLRADRARWLAAHWAREEGGRWIINADPAHKRPQPFLYRVEEVKAIWAQIACPTLLVEGADTNYFAFWTGRYGRDEYLARTQVIGDFRVVTVADAGHMLHHDQPEAVAEHLAAHLALPKCP